ncbi:hypothetical protein [Streptomyces sp. NPDC093970]|uniref:hypothetical protein n=1 Tax=Streptomyces sp. NPDC093970 TaxID=3155076 RepID=UPI0034143863
MANRHKEKLRGIRGIDDALWADLDHAAQGAGSDRSKVTKQLWEWFVGRPGAELPKRPRPVRRPAMDCERCHGTGLDPHAYIVQRGADGVLQAQIAAPCPDCRPDDDPDVGSASGEEATR